MADGNKVGKSLVLKSVYHAMGADCFFDDNFDEKEKHFLISFHIGDMEYKVLRKDNLFRVYSNTKKIFETIHRHDLGNFYSELLSQKIFLYNRKKSIETVPPAFYFILNYIDQDNFKGSNFKSFKSLEEYTNYKEDLLLCIFGVYDESYYQNKIRLEEIKKILQELGEERNMLSRLVNKIRNDLLEKDYSSTIDALKKEIELNHKEYVHLIGLLGKTKEKIIKYRNSKDELILELESIPAEKSKISEDLKIINTSKCPFCRSLLDNVTKMRAYSHNAMEELVEITEKIEIEIKKIDGNLEKEQDRYKSQLSRLNEYKENIKFAENDMEDVLKNIALVNIRDSIIFDLSDLDSRISAQDVEKERLSLETKKKESMKGSIDKMYERLMLEEIEKHNIQEISEEKVKSITKVFNASGSSVELSTLIWYNTLQKIKSEYNKNSISLPMIVDGAFKGEIDDDKRSLILDYLLNEMYDGNQMLFSILGFELKDSKNINKIINIDSPKYKLLSKQCYETHIGELNMLLRVNQNHIC